MSADINTNNNSETPYYSESTPIDSPCNPDLHKETFRTNFNWLIFIIWLIFTAFVLSFIVLLIKDFHIIFLITMIIMILLISLTLGCVNLQIVITVDPPAGILTVKKYSTCIFFWKKFKCDLKDIRKIYSTENDNVHRQHNEREYPDDIIIELTNGEKITLLSGSKETDNKNKKKILEFLYKFLPTVVVINSEKRVYSPGESFKLNISDYIVNTGSRNLHITTPQPNQYPEQQALQQTNYSTPQNNLTTQNVENMYPSQNELDKQFIDKQGNSEASPTSM